MKRTFGTRRFQDEDSETKISFRHVFLVEWTVASTTWGTQLLSDKVECAIALLVLRSSQSKRPTRARHAGCGKAVSNLNQSARRRCRIPLQEKPSGAWSFDASESKVHATRKLWACIRCYLRYACLPGQSVSLLSTSSRSNLQNTGCHSTIFTCQSTYKVHGIAF